jgi:hypothetical protein
VGRKTDVSNTGEERGKRQAGVKILVSSKPSQLLLGLGGVIILLGKPVQAVQANSIAFVVIFLLEIIQTKLSF